jgi:HSP20 family protein
MRSDPAMAERKLPHTDFEHVAEHLEHMWDHLLNRGGPGSPRYARPVIEPPTDVYHTDTEIVVLVEIAGMREEEVEIQLEGRRMTVRGEKRDRRARQPGRNYHTMEIQYGPFERTIVLPADADHENVTVQYDDGLLQIVFPKRAREEQRRVRITVH